MLHGNSLSAALLLLALLLQLTPLVTLQDPGLKITYELDGQKRAVSEEDLQDLLRDNLQQDLQPWLPHARSKGALTALDFLDLLHDIDTRWPPYRRNFLAIVAIRNNTFQHWSYPTARGWCMRRVKAAAEEFSKYIQSHGLQFPDAIYVMNAYDKPLCAAGMCSAPIFSFGKCWQPAMPSVTCPPADTNPRNTKRRPGSEAISVSAALGLVAKTAHSPGTAAGAGGTPRILADVMLAGITQQLQAEMDGVVVRAGVRVHGRGRRKRGSRRMQKGPRKERMRRALQGAQEPTALQVANCTKETRRLQAAGDQQVNRQPQMTYHQWPQQLHEQQQNSQQAQRSQQQLVGQQWHAQQQDIQQLPTSQQQSDWHQLHQQHHTAQQHQQDSQPVSVSQQTAGRQQTGPRGPYDDILFPVMNHPFDQLISYPWDKKTDVAFMRAGLYAAMSPNCSRVLLYKLAQQQQSQGLLDVGIYQNRHPGVQTLQAAAVPIEEHARYRYLFNTDGQAASWRLAKLLAINSALLKWRSPHIEYYYRSLVPGKHYLDVSQHDVLSVLHGVRQADQQQKLQDMATESQKFAYRYLSQLSRAAYARSALSGYKSLFAPGQQELLLASVAAAGKPNMADLLMLRQRLRANTVAP